MIRLILGASPGALCTLDDNSIDSIVTDPPYGLSFMGKRWDYDVPSVDVWRECLRVLKPGGHLLAFAGTRTQHRMAVRIEDAGFEIRDMIAWVYATGFPKSLDVLKAIDARGGASVAWFGPWFRKWREDNGITQKQVAALFPSKSGGLTGCVANWELGFNMPTPAQFNLIRDTFGLPFDSVEEAEREVVGHGYRVRRESTVQIAVCSDGEFDITAPATDAARQWQGWGTALKPALEPITVARKPLDGTVAETVLRWGTGAINVDGCRVKAVAGDEPLKWEHGRGMGFHGAENRGPCAAGTSSGRFPANLIHDGSDEVVGLFPVTGPAKSGGKSGSNANPMSWTEDNAGRARGGPRERRRLCGPQGLLGRAPGGHDDAGGSAARFFYCAKASKRDREDGCDHLPARTAGEVTGGREEGSAGLDSPRAGAGRGQGSRNFHPTVKPTDLMRYLCRLVTPPGGTVLDPFMGSGSTGRGAVLEGFGFVGVEMDPDYMEIAKARIAVVAPEPEEPAPVVDVGQLKLL